MRQPADTEDRPCPHPADIAPAGSPTAGVAAALALAPGAAAANPDRSAPPDVVPLVDCVTVHADGSWTAVFGYDDRTGATVEIPVGPANQVTPESSGQPQPTTFLPGVRHGAVQVTVPRGGGPVWHLGRDDLPARSISPGGTRAMCAPCPFGGPNGLSAYTARRTGGRSSGRVPAARLREHARDARDFVAVERALADRHPRTD
ncbi:MULTISPECIES: hypothetical protein [unclassified Blastococcus]